MYQPVGAPRTAPASSESPGQPDAESAARLALGRVRKALASFVPGMSFAPERLRSGLAAPVADACLEAERCFALGWLAWLAGDVGAAEAPLAQAAAQAQALQNSALLAESAYWRARVQILAGRADAVAGFEAVLRTLGGSPQAAAWFVDLLWRAGRSDRAEQVWKSVRGNRKVTACDEGPLLEARSLLQRGELAPAERVLNETGPSGGVVQAERCLLLAWATAGQKQPQGAAEWLDKAAAGLYPEAALRAWRELVEGRARGEPLHWTDGASAALRELLRGFEALRRGEADEAASAFREALATPALQPFARYGLVWLGREDAAALLTAQPGFFLGVRCRARSALERFRRREVGPAEWLDALQAAAAAGFQEPAAEHFRRLAQWLQRPPTADELRRLVDEETAADCEAGRNVFRAALELAAKRLPAEEARGLLTHWAELPWLAGRPELGALLGRQMLRLGLTGAAGAVSVAEQLLPGDGLAALVRSLTAESAAESEGDAPPARLWRAACDLARLPSPVQEGTSETPDGSQADSVLEAEDRRRAELRVLAGEARWRPLAQALRLHHAALLGEVDEAAAPLEEADAWGGFRSGPPRFVTRALESLAAAQPTHVGLRRALAAWLPRWGATFLGGDGARLAAALGLEGATGAAPPGVPPGPWLLHQAARAVRRGGAAEALALARRAVAADPALSDDAALRDALPELERRARAQALGVVLAPEGDAVEPALLVDAVDLLAQTEGGPALAQACEAGDRDAAGRALAALADRPDLPPRLAHHFALLQQRAALALDDQGQTEAAEPHWRLAWRSWLRVLAALPPEAAADGGLLLDHLLGLHRRRVNDLLSRSLVERARLHWVLVQELPALAAASSGPLGQAVGERASRFRDDLAADYLAATREAMRYGDVAEGMRADYELGLGWLRRLLSLDRDSLRLLTALVEVCGEWFLDLYNVGRPAALAEQVERFTPFALQLARLAEARPGDLAARAALAEYYKFRGFVAGDRGQKAALYREALRFNPANDNVRQLLADMGEG
jgi:hypothetical protein